MDINDNTTTGTSTTTEQGLNGNQLYPKVDNMDPVIGHDSDQSDKTTVKQSTPKNEANFNIHCEERPILNGVVSHLSPDGNKEMRITDVKLETLKSKTTWQEMSPKRERKITRQNSSGSIKSSSSGSASGTSGSSDYSSCSPPGSPTKSWKSIRESNKNNALSWKDLSGTKCGKSSEEHLPSKGTSANENQFGKCVCSPEHVRNQTTCDTDNACITTTGTDMTDNRKMDTGHLTSCVHTTDNGQNLACNCKTNGGSRTGQTGRTGQNVNNRNQGSPEHRVRMSTKSKDPCRLESATSEEQNNEYFYDEDFTVQFDTNLRESSPGLNCTCIDPTIVSDFPNIVTGSYLSFNNMKGSGLLDPHANPELFCPDESELSSCRNSAMDLSSSEREMMCSSDMLEFSDNPLFTPSPTKELEKQNVSTDSLDRNYRPIEHCCQDGSLESSDGNLCVNCCPKKEDYFLSFDGSQGRSQNSENDNSLISIGSGHGHWGQSSSGEEMVSEECTDSFHFCYMNGNGSLQHGHRRIKFQALKAVHEDNDDADIDDSEGKLSLPKITRSPISEFNQKVNGGLNGKRGCCHGKKAQVNKFNGLSPSKSAMRHTIPNRRVTSWKQVKSLKSLGKMDMMLDANRSSSMPELYVQTWQSVTSQDCMDIAKIAESFHGKRHSAYLLDLYQRVRNQSNPVSPETMANIEQILFHPLISQNRCHGEANLSAPIGPCGVCGREGSHSSHTLTNSNIQHLVNTSRSGQQLDQYTRKRIIEWLERDRLDGQCRAKGSQTERDVRTVETIISPTTVTLWCGTKNFGSQFPPHTRDCGIQTSHNVGKEGRVLHTEQQTSPTLEREYRKLYTAEAAQQTSPNSEKHDILSMLPENFTDLEDIIPRRDERSPTRVPRSKSADTNAHRDTVDVAHRGCLSYYTYKSLPELNFIVSPEDHRVEEEISLFDPMPVSIPIPILTPTFAKSFSGALSKKERQSAGTANKRSMSVPAKLVTQPQHKSAGETGSSASGVSNSSTSSGIDPGYSTEDRPFSVGSPSNDIERLLFYPPHVENSAKKEKGQGQIEGQGQHRSSSQPNLRRVSENLVNRYANEAHPISLEAVHKPRVTEPETESKGDGKVLVNPAVEQLYSLQEENTPLSSPDVSRCHHNCCHGEDCFFVNHPNQFSSESNSSKESGPTKSNRKPLKSCLRKQHFLRSRSLSDPHNLAQNSDSQKQKKKLNRHSYACEEVYLLTDDAGQYYLCQSDNSLQSSESSGPVLFYLDNMVPTDGTQTVKLRRKNPTETGTRPVTETADTLSGKRKSVSFASEVSFHDISPHASPKHRVEETGTEITKATELPVLTRGNSRANSPESYESSDSDVPPDSFKLSPSTEQNIYAHRFDELERKRGMLMEVCQVAEIILHHFSKAKNPFDKLRLGSSADTSEIGDLVLNRLCPVLNRVVGDGLKPFLNGFQMFGRVNVTVWKVAEISAEQGPYTRAIHDLVQQLKSNPGLTSCSAKFEAFLFGLLNLRLLDYWMGYLRYSDNLTDKFYNSDGVIILSRTCHERAYDEMLISLQPLSVLPFQLGLEYVLENSKYLSHSPTLSPNRNRSPLISPSLERNIVVPPPKPARSLNGTGLISTKAWEWIKGSVCDEGAEQKSTGAEHSNVVEKREEVSANRSDRFGEKRSKSLDDVQEGRVQRSRDKEVQRPVCTDLQVKVDLQGMTDSFSGIAQKLLGMNTSRDKSPEDSITKNPTGSGSEKNSLKEKVTAPETVESVSSKAKSGILKFFDKLLLSKDSGSAPKSQIPKRYSWNVPNEGQRSPGSPGCKSLSPVSGNKELRNSLEYQKQKFVTARKTQKSDNVVARSIQSEATKDIESEATKAIPKEATKDDRKPGLEKSGEKSGGRIRKTPEKIESVTEKPLSRQARNPPSNLNLKLREEAQDKMSVKVTASPSKKFGSPQRKVTDKVKVSKIPTLQKKIESRRPQRNSLVLDSSGYSSSSMVSSPTRVKHSYSAGQIPIPVQSPKKNKVQCSKNAEVSTIKKEPVRTETKAPEEAGITSSTEFPINDPTESVESTSSSASASLEIGPTLIAPAQRKDTTSASQKLTAEKSQNKTKPPVSGALMQDLDINSNAPLPMLEDQAVGAGGQCTAGQTTNHGKDFMKPDFRCIETVLDFESKEISQLSYKKGEHFEVLAEIDSSWFYCVNGPQEGLIHVNAVKPLSDKDEFHLLHNNFYS
ncbi:uncharacterized protein LOC125661855 isoform X1 [Ostrea edulis]|uniref:uncharacterized protein LOC125661855 isoform X1 n=1 Tax=Ostrea edulis TaxID=37623 RepID=UPI0024AF51F4|nr:uncharacterized protein LOC125661855 isoform X1 [Ostrea edulis]